MVSLVSRSVSENLMALEGSVIGGVGHVPHIRVDTLTRQYPDRFRGVGYDGRRELGRKSR